MRRCASLAAAAAAAGSARLALRSLLGVSAADGASSAAAAGGRRFGSLSPAGPPIASAAAAAAAPTISAQTRAPFTPAAATACHQPWWMAAQQSASGRAWASSDSFAAAEAASTSSSTEKGVPKPGLVDRLMALELAAAGEQLRAARGSLVSSFRRHGSDVGSPDVVVAQWTARIRELARTFQHHRKNVHMIRRMELMLHRRRRLLMYMRRTDFDAYCYVVHKLGLKDMYQRIRADDRYPEGSVHGEPADGARVRRLRFAFHPEHRQKKTSLWRRLRPKLVEEDPSLADLKP